MSENRSRCLTAEAVCESEAPAAITNAVMDALYSTGVRHTDTPLTPEKILRVLSQ